MSKGILIYALNNEQIDYVKLAVNAAQKAKKYINAQVALVTDSADWLYQQYPNWNEYFDFVIRIVDQSDIENWQSNKYYGVGNLAFYNGTIWRKVKEGNETLSVINKQYKKKIDIKNFDPVYVGIDIDKWYPNLPYLAGQHVWHDDVLYRCHTSYEEADTFSKNQYDILIENVQDSDSNPEYKSGDIILYNRNLWQTHKNIDDPISFNPKYFDSVYKGIDIDKWYPNLPYLKGQHVWYENTLYRCEIGYTESETFTKNKYIVLLENVKEFDSIDSYFKGDIFLKDRTLWQANVNLNTEKILTAVWYDMTDLEKVYEGIEIDKWYPNLPYLAGQHVWYKDTLYRCHTDYKESDEFSIDNYDVLVENVKDLKNLEKFSIGDILFHDRILWMSKVNFDINLNEDKIRDDIWEDTRERFLVHNSSVQYRRYFDGTLSHKRLRFRNDIRIRTFELSPFDETLVIDSDYLINNHILKYCWEQPHDFLIHKKAIDLSGYRYDPRLQTVSDKGVDFYWATVFFFRKNKNTETFFNLLGHIQENWNYYRLIYQIEHSLYRNDYAFSIAIHIMNGYQDGYWAHDLPGKMYYTTDRDILIEDKDGVMKFLIEKEKYLGEYTLLKTNKLNIHVMNKYSISRILDQPHDIEYSL